MVVYGGYEGWQVVPGACQSRGLFHGEVAQGRVEEQLTTPRSRGHQEGDKGAGGRGTAVLIPL